MEDLRELLFSSLSDTWSTRKRLEHWFAGRHERRSSSYMADAKVLAQETEVLRAEVDRLELVVLAFAELLVNKVGVSPLELDNTLRKADLLSGREDGRLYPTRDPVQVCASCQRASDPGVNLPCPFCGEREKMFPVVEEAPPPALRKPYVPHDGPTKQCPNCGLPKPVEDFLVDESSDGTSREVCKRCVARRSW